MSETFESPFTNRFRLSSNAAAFMESVTMPATGFTLEVQKAFAHEFINIYVRY